MSELSVIGNIYQLRTVGKLEGQDCINVIHFEALQADQDIVTQLLVVFYLCFLNQLVPHLSSAFSLDRMEVKRVAPTVGPVWEYGGTVGDVLAGVAEGDGEPSFVSVRTDIRCLRGGRSGKGSISIGGIPEGATVFSTINTAGDFWTHFQSWLECVRAAFLMGHGFDDTRKFCIGVVSRKLGTNKPPFATAQFSRAVSLSAKPKVGSQNSRKVGHGS
jgi:hypothetical protein